MEHILMVEGKWRRPTISGMEARLVPQNAELMSDYRRMLNGSYSVSHAASLYREALKFTLVQQNAGANPTKAGVESVIEYCESIDSASAIVKAQREGYLRVFMEFLATFRSASPALGMVANRHEIGRAVLLRAADRDRLVAATEDAVCPYGQVDLEAIRVRMSEFLEEFTACRYSETRIYSARHALRGLYIFLAANGLSYSSEASAVWEELVATGNSSYDRDVHRMLFLFEGYLQDGFVNPAAMDERADSQFWRLPRWSKGALSSFLEGLRHERLAPSSVKMYRNCCVRLILFMEERGIAGWDKLDAGAVRDFHLQDAHSTVEGKNAYSSRIRRFLDHLADEGLCEPLLSRLLPGSRAVATTVVETLSDTDLERIKLFRESASTPMELRDAAIVTLGIDAGLRGCDIVGLKISDVDWSAPSARIVQRKTKVGLTIPLTTEAANSLYLYIVNGRPDTTSANVFVKHRAPFGPLTRSACQDAIARALDDPGRTGFHVTRKTFASRMMAASVPVEVIAEALGHSTNDTVSKYLAKNESRMRECAMPLSAIPLTKGVLL